MTPLEFDYLCALVRERSAIVIEDGKQYLVEARLAPMLRELEMKEVGELVMKLRGEPAGKLAEDVVDAMTTNETSFYRDLYPFDMLRDDILPKLIKERAAQKTLRIWCAASSTGQEPYSIAMLIHKHFPQLKDWNVDLFATDISKRVLERAKSGIYSQIEINRGLPAPLLVKYFKQDKQTWELSKEIRDMVRFDFLNLAGIWPHIPECDVVFIRNVLIYFDHETKSEILRKIAGLLKPDGYLFLGGSETTMNLVDDFTPVRLDRGIVYRLGDAE